MTNALFRFVKFTSGGNNRARTCDIMLVRHALSQLSYAPKMPEILSVKTSKSLRFFRSHTLSYPKSVRLSNGFTRVFNNYTGFARTKALHCDTPGRSITRMRAYHQRRRHCISSIRKNCISSPRKRISLYTAKP